MNEKTFEQHIDIALSPSERAELRRRLVAFMEEHPPKLTLGERFYELLALRVRYGVHPAVVALTLVVITSGGAVTAAQSALPGDFLYPVKLTVTEPLAGALSTSAASRAKWNAALALRRLEEAETLAVQNRLTPPVQAYIAAQFIKHADGFETHMQELARQGEETVLATAEVQSDLEATLAAHAQILTTLSASSTGVSDQPILSKVRERVVRTMQSREEAESGITKKGSDALKAAAIKKERDAQALLSRRGTKKDTRGETARFSAASVQSESSQSIVSDTAAVFEQGRASFNEGRYGEAFTKFQAVIRREKVEEKVGEIERKLREKIHNRGSETKLWRATSSTGSDESGD